VCIELGDAGGSRGGVHGPVQLPRGHRVDAILAREQPAACHDESLGVRLAPPGAQPFQHQRRQDRVPILASLGLLDAQRHACTVDVARLQRNDLAGAQAGAIRQRQCRLVLQAAGGCNQARHFIAAEHDRQPLLHPHLPDPGHHRRPIQRDLEQEPERRERRVERDRRHTRLDKVQLEAPQILGRGRVGRAAQKPGQPPHAADVGLLRAVLHPPHAHVFDHALAQR